MRDDGKGCLEDLDEVRKLDPEMDARLAATRGPCEMLVGRCRAGKQRIAHWYEVEAAMTAERAAAAAEQLGAMRCRKGSSSCGQGRRGAREDGKRLLRAFLRAVQALAGASPSGRQ